MTNKVLINGWQSKSGAVFYGREGKAKAMQADRDFEVSEAAQALSTLVVPPWSDADVLGSNLANHANAQAVFKLAACLMNAGVMPDASVGAPTQQEPRRASIEEIQAQEETREKLSRAAGSRKVKARAHGKAVAAKAQSKAGKGKMKSRSGGRDSRKAA